ncbi:hypothetical protein N8289_03725 [Flavobacteriales bacterium]|nr:hypothetical protein [Flavobacteriales bacterium]
MKNLILLFTLIGCYANLNAADIYVNNSGAPGTYATISAALTAASNGDILFISPYSVYDEAINIDKSVTLVSSIAGVLFTIEDVVTITGAPNMEIKMIGAMVTSTFLFNPGTSSLTNKAKFFLIGSETENVYLDHDNLEFHALYSNLNSIKLKHGEVIGCETRGNISVLEGSAVDNGDTLSIIGNVVGGQLFWASDDHYFLMSNNYVKRGLTVNNYLNHSTNLNLITNSTITEANSNISAYQAASNINYPMNAVVEINKMFSTSSTNYNAETNISILSCIIIQEYTGSYQAYAYTGKINYYGSSSNNRLSTDFPFKYCSEYRVAYVTPPVIDNYGRSNDIGQINKGIASIEYYDINLTRNDIGTYGGPRSINNYIDTASGNGRVYDLNIPFQIWSGQTPQVKAKSVNTK